MIETLTHHSSTYKMLQASRSFAFRYELSFQNKSFFRFNCITQGKSLHRNFGNYSKELDSFKRKMRRNSSENEQNGTSSTMLEDTKFNKISDKVEKYLEESSNMEDTFWTGRSLDSQAGEGLLAATLIGVCTGLAVCLFEETQAGVKGFFLSDWLSFLGATKLDMLDIYGNVTQIPTPGVSWPIATIPLFGGLAITAMRFALKKSETTLAPTLKDLNKDPSKAVEITPWKPALKAGAAAVTLGTANSLGPEGPVVELGGNIGLWLGSKLGYSGGDLRGFLAAGTAAGLAAGFNAPIAAIFFSLEVVLQQTNDRQLLTVTLLSAVISAAVKDALLGLEPKFIVESDLTNGLPEVPMFLLVGAACGAMAFLLEEGMAKSRRAFDAVPDAIPEEAHPMIGSVFMAATALVIPQTLFLGYGGIDQMLQNGYISWGAVVTLLALASVKVVTTSVCSTSGLVGGVFAPSLFIGAATGAAVGTGAQLLGLGSYNEGLGFVSQPSIYALIGMPAMLAAYVNAPLTSILLLFEVTRDYGVMLPVMAGVSMSTFTNMQLGKMFQGDVDDVPSFLKGLDVETLSGTLALRAIVRDFITLPGSTKLLGFARTISEVQISQGVQSCQGVVITNASGQIMGALSVKYLVTVVTQMTSDLRAAFQEFDEDNSNTIEEHEIFALLTKVGTDITVDEVSSIFATIDSDESGAISFNEFCSGASIMGVRAGLRTLQDAFDSDGEVRGVLPTSSSLLDVANVFENTASSAVAVVDESTGQVVGIVLEEGLIAAAGIAAIENSLGSLEV